MPPIVSLHRIPIPTITIAELMVKEPPSDPIRAIVPWRGEVPVVACMGVVRAGNARHCLVLQLLDNIAPVVGGLARAVALEMALVGR